MKAIFELREFMRVCDKGEQQEAEELDELEKRDLVNEETKNVTAFSCHEKIQHRFGV